MNHLFTLNPSVTQENTAMLHPNKRLTVISLALLVGLAMTPSALAGSGMQNSSAAKWQPVASDKLIKLPANIIEKRIEQDFQASPMAMRMVALESEMQDMISDIKTLANVIPEQGSDALLDHQYQAIEYKSQYLDLMQESHQLRQSALGQKQDLYKNVLDKIRHQSGKIAGSSVYQLKQAQASARSRMEKVMARVDQALVHSGAEKPSAYSDEYSKNLGQIEKLKLAITRHKGNESPQRDGVDISSEEYIRQLLMSVSSEQSLLDQEALMLSYMAKLVALDAQTLEFVVAYGQNADVERVNQTTKAASVTSLFY